MAEQVGVFADSVLPCVETGLVDLVDGGHMVDDSLIIEDAAGHTHGTVLIHANGGSQRGVFSGDIIHSSLQIAFPDVNSVACAFPKEARMVRRRVLAQCAESGAFLLPAHFPPPRFGQIAAAGDRFSFIPRR